MTPCAHWCSPPARGWTGLRRQNGRVGEVFPARAGMDRCRWGSNRRGDGVPRPRGDGPASCLRPVSGPVCSPPARGWTVLREAGLGTVDVFPARAGMDRRRRRRWPSCSGVPRPRGDGPMDGARGSSRHSCSPPARGWTDDGVDAERHHAVFPARAGMDRRRRRRWRPQRRVPRPRGDGPTDLGVGSISSSCSPPARGWTGREEAGRRLLEVFPARAGMDRWTAPADRPATRVPRPRGDGPGQSIARVWVGLCSPPARGWTARVWMPNDRYYVFPARAGMDRIRSRSRTGATCVPRPRGDGPMAGNPPNAVAMCSPPARGWTGYHGAAAARAMVFPARAGMDRHRGTDVSQEGGVPRPRGDGPSHSPFSSRVCQCSPPARGWTGVSACHLGRGSCVPRPRGDGPNDWLPDGFIRRCSPPARGWTDDRAGHRRRAVVFPARAGMDRCCRRDRRAPVFPARAGMDRCPHTLAPHDRDASAPPPKKRRI